jgi:DNA gyrase subunit A
MCWSVQSARRVYGCALGFISPKFTAKVDKVVIIQLIDNTTEMMVMSQFGKIIRIDTKSVRAVGRSNSGVKASIT